MAIVYPDIHSFIGGLLTPKLEGRVDYAKYGVGCRVLKNFIVAPTGGIFRRPGFHFVAKAKMNNVRLIPFDFNGTESQSYVLELGDGYIRFFARGGQVVSGGSTPLELVVPQLVGMDLSKLNYVQSADVIYFAHTKMQPWRLERLSATSWAYQAMSFLDDGAAAAAATLAARTATFQAASIEYNQANSLVNQATTNLANAYKGGNATDIAYWEGEVTRLTVILVSKEKARESARTAMNTAAATVEAGGTGLPFYGDNWPGKVRIYEDRLVYAATPRQPLNIWMSRLADFNDFRLNTNTQTSDYTMSPLDEDSIWLRLNGSRVNPIQWLLDIEQLVVGTNASEIRIQGRDIDAPLTPSTAGHKRQSSYGSNNVQAIMLGSSAMFCSRSGSDVYTLDYQDFGYRFKSAPLNLLSPEATQPSVIEMHSMGEPEPIAWFILSDGTLSGCTYIRDQQIYGWHTHDTQGKIKSGAIIPYEKGDQFWVAVERDGQTFIEYLETPFDYRADNAVNNVFVDALLSGTASQGGKLAGMPHLAGKKVQVVTNGSYVGELTVDTAGAIYDSKIMKGAHVVAGLSYVSEVQPMRPNYAVPRKGSNTAGVQSIHVKKRVLHIMLRVLGSIKGEIRAEYEQPVPGLSPGEMGEWQKIVAFPHGTIGSLPPPCRTETVEINLSGNSSVDGLVRVRQTEPFPLFITAIAYGIDQPQGI